MYEQIKRSSRKGNIRRITITEVNMANNYVSGTDRFNKLFQATLSFQDPVVTIPAIGELWAIEQYQQEWRLIRKVGSDLSNLNPGDKRIDSPTVINLEAPTISIDGTVSLITRKDPEPIANTAIIYSRLNNSFKTELCVQFPTGSPIIIATEP